MHESTLVKTWTKPNQDIPRSKISRWKTSIFIFSSNSPSKSESLHFPKTPNCSFSSALGSRPVQVVFINLYQKKKKKRDSSFSAWVKPPINRSWQPALNSKNYITLAGGAAAASLREKLINSQVTRAEWRKRASCYRSPTWCCVLNICPVIEFTLRS